MEGLSSPGCRAPRGPRGKPGCAHTAEPGGGAAGMVAASPPRKGVFRLSRRVVLPRDQPLQVGGWLTDVQG